MYNQHIILDFEMNPVSEKNKKIRKALCDEIIEIGAVKLNSCFEVVDRFNCFVRPQFSSEISGQITKLTGITSADIHNAVSFSEALQKFEEWVGAGKSRIYSWSDNDLIQLRKECIYKGLEFPDKLSRWVDFQVVFPVS